MSDLKNKWLRQLDPNEKKKEDQPLQRKMSIKELKDLSFVSSYNVFCIKYVKGMCGCRK
jgi:hypothetical protein